MRQLEEENLRLKRLIADLNLGKAMLQDMLARLCEWVRDIQIRFSASERQICFALRLSQSAFRYRSVAADGSAFFLRISGITGTRILYEYLRVYVILRRGGWRDNRLL
ncbi:hypothetical protein [Pectobacterium versatile]|uniref:hypothetical protein n=1 Tax=Pectobacterium versatile TaxID=2488639 RepID=UPI0032EFBB06